MADSLSPAQTETYQALQLMGFGDAECVAAAETFGQNVQGAINYLLTAPTGSAPAQSAQQTTKVETEEDTYFEVPPCIFSRLLTAGYLRREHTMDVPDGIQLIITEYFSFLFIKFRYDISDESDKHDELRVLEKDRTFREMMLQIEEEEKYEHIEDVDDTNKSLPVRVDGYPTYCCFWLRFFALRVIYAIDKRITVTQQQIDECNENPNRWVEIPSDYDKSKVGDILEWLTESYDAEYVMEIAVEKFDLVKQVWPFRCAAGSDSDDEPMWRFRLKIGDIVDCKDEQEKWYESVIRFVEHQPWVALENKRFPDNMDESDIQRWKTLETIIVKEWLMKISVPGWIEIERVVPLVADKGGFAEADVYEWIAQYGAYSNVLEVEQPKRKRIRMIECFVYVHYIGWNIKWDSRINVLDPNLARRGTHTRGAHKPNRHRLRL